jgi:hypothetical protein
VRRRSAVAICGKYDTLLQDGNRGPVPAARRCRHDRRASLPAKSPPVALESRERCSTSRAVDERGDQFGLGRVLIVLRFEILV